MTTSLGRMVSRAFKPDTPEIPKAGFGRIRGSKPRVAGAMTAPSRMDDEVGPMTVGNARTKGANPPMAGGTCPFPKSDDPRSTGISMITSMTTKEEGAKVPSQGVSVNIHPNLSLIQLI